MTGEGPTVLGDGTCGVWRANAPLRRRPTVDRTAIWAVEEIYYHLLCDEHGGALRSQLRLRGEVQRIVGAVDCVHRNVSTPVSVRELAQTAHIGLTAFHETFRSVMHIPPLQCVKRVQLYRAHALIRERKTVGEARYLVGYNSPAPFSREYKRHFGFAPSGRRISDPKTVRR